MKTALVTGGAGFIGANLVHRLFAEGYNVHIVAEKNSDYWRLETIKKNIQISEISLTEFEKITTLITFLKPEFIFHLASFGGMPHQQDQSEIFRTNFDGTVNLYNACKEVGFECFINTGSSSEYGMKSGPMSEDLVLEPVSDYGVAKAAATQLCLKEALFHKLPVYTVRPFSIYGNYEMPTRLIPSVIIKALRNEPITISSPYNVRDFTFIDDMVEMYMQVAQQKPTSAFIFNAGTGVQSSIHDVVNTIQTLCNKKLDLRWGAEPSRPWEPVAWQADITRTQQILNWKPEYTLVDGLRKTIIWFDKNLSWFDHPTPYVATADKGPQENKSHEVAS